MKARLTLIIGFFLLFWVFKAASQITLDSYPDDLFLECNDSPEGYDTQAVYDWIDEYINNVIVTSDCDPVDEVWTHDYTGTPITDCFGDISVDFTVTDACGNQEFVLGLVMVEDLTSPNLEPPTISSHTLYCESDGTILGLQDLIDQDFYFDVEDDDCSGAVELMMIPDVSILECDSEYDFDVYTMDECGNPSELHTITIAVEYIQVQFESNLISLSEADQSVQVCLTLSTAADEAIVVELQRSNTSTATNGVDYVNLPTIQTFTFPANSTTEQCFTLTSIEDILPEPDERITFEITSIAGGNAVIGVDDTTEITILDNDDDDNDGIENSIDNCPNTANQFQEDFDGDGIGDVCDGETTISQVAEFQDYIYVNKLYSDIIVQSNNGNCWVIVVQNDGSINTVSVSCPD